MFLLCICLNLFIIPYSPTIIGIGSVSRLHVRVTSIPDHFSFEVSPFLLEKHCRLLVLIYRLESISNNYIRPISLISIRVCWHIPEYGCFLVFFELLWDMSISIFSLAIPYFWHSFQCTSWPVRDKIILWFFSIST